MNGWDDALLLQVLGKDALADAGHKQAVRLFASEVVDAHLATCKKPRIIVHDGAGSGAGRYELLPMQLVLVEGMPQSKLLHTFALVHGHIFDDQDKQREVLDHKKMLKAATLQDKRVFNKKISKDSEYCIVTVLSFALPVVVQETEVEG